MPIWLRKFTFNKLKEHYDAIAAQKENMMINEENPNRTVSKPDVLKNIGKEDSYNVRASRK